MEDSKNQRIMVRSNAVPPGLSRDTMLLASPSTIVGSFSYAELLAFFCNATVKVGGYSMPAKLAAKFSDLEILGYNDAFLISYPSLMKVNL